MAKDKEREEHKLICARTRVVVMNEDFENAPQGDRFVKLRFEGDPVNTPLHEKSN